MKNFVQIVVLLLWGAGLCRAADVGKVTTQANVEYGTVDGQKLLLDIFAPEDTAKIHPAVIFVHGGAWQAGSKENFSEAAVRLAQQGFVCFSIDYRLMTDAGNRWPDQIDDTQRAVRWVRAHADAYHVDPKRLGAVGASAGGQLVALLGTTERRDNSDASLASYSSHVQCVVDMYGPVDLTKTFIGKQAWVDALLKKLFNGQADGPVAQEASPLFHVDAKSAPFLIFHGKLDDIVPLEQSQRMDAALRKAGIESKLIVFDNEGHGFSRPENKERFNEELLQFLKAQLKP